MPVAVGSHSLVAGKALLAYDGLCWGKAATVMPSLGLVLPLNSSVRPPGGKQCLTKFQVMRVLKL